MILLLIILMAMAVSMRLSRAPDPLDAFLTHPVQNGFLFGLPLLLIAFLASGARWVLMAGVMYGTIGLAWDISTIVQELAAPAPQHSLVLLSGVSGTVNFGLILVGGRGFLDVSSDST
jgi:hypothetical protein